MGVNILLTGASGGVGKEIVKVLQSMPGKLLFTSPSKDKLDVLVNATKKVEKRNLQILSVPLDLANISNIKILEQKSHEFFADKLDILINNAGIGYHCQVENIQQEELVETFYINTLSPILLTSRMLSLLKKSNNPKVINISSILGSKGIPYTASYTASKHALNGYSKVLRKELVDENLKVVIIEPGAIESDFILRTHDKVPKDKFDQRKLEKLKPGVIATWVLKVIESDNNTCPELIRILPQHQII